jgi:hypothetical protein
MGIERDKNRTRKENGTKQQQQPQKQDVQEKLDEMTEAEQSRLTLLFGLRANTISECTFRLLSLPSIKSLTALNAAANACTLETTFVFQCQPRPNQDFMLASI